MTHLDDILDTALLGQMIDEGYVQVRYHPDYPYAIYCYTKQAMFDRKWNEVTMVCRGLIVNEDSGEVLARPFKKFFNVGEPDAPVFGHSDWTAVYDKADGSLGIAYETPDGPAIATKGSFTSEQALFATELLRTQYGRYMHDDMNTDLFEIIYPENRIVLDYGDTKELRYLGSVNIEDGTDYWNGLLMKMWGIPRNNAMESGPFYQLRLNLNRPNAEGYVLHNEDTGDRVKLKQEDYLELHKIMTGLNERQLWQWLSEGRTFNEILKSLPEELHDWAKPFMGHLLEERELIQEACGNAFQYHIKKAENRKEFAQGIAQYPKLDKAVMFCMADGQFDRAEQLIWNALRP